jgi:osmoprotectant transport system ATP-binding protein
MFELENVSKSFGANCVLQPTSLRIPSGSTTVLIGPSGCGKSTLLRLLVGLLKPDSGTIRFAGEELNEKRLPSQRLKMGYVIQDGGLFPHLSLRDNLSLMPKQLQWDRQRLDTRIRELAQLTRLPLDLLNRFPGQISGGQRQRVGIMRALILDPSVILLDEPMGALDPMVRYDLQEDLRTIFRSLNKTVVMVTHDLGEADFFGDSICLLYGGSILQQGKLSEMASQPASAYVTQFLKAQRFPQITVPTT